MSINEAIAKVKLVRDDIRNYKTDKYSDISYDERLDYMKALAILINIAEVDIESAKAKTKKTGLDLFLEVLKENKPLL